MANQEFVYEQRQVTLRKGALEEYVQQIRELQWPQLDNDEARVLCLLHGMIGYPVDDVIQITRFTDIGAWQRSQGKDPLPANPLVEKEDVRLLRSVASRPKPQVPAEDRREVYGYHRFFIRAEDLPEFVRCSETGVWPRIETQDACILGLWTTLAATDPLEVALLTGYHSVTHWEETRGARPMPQGFDPDLWERSVRLRARRADLCIKDWVCLMRAIEVAPSG